MLLQSYKITRVFPCLANPDIKREIGFRTFVGFAILIALVIIGGTSHGAEKTSAIPEVPVKGMVTMVDIGAKACIPCKMMAPIMEKMEKVYQGKAAIIFIDVWKNPGAGAAVRRFYHSHSDFLRRQRQRGLSPCRVHE